ncbi:MAG TPA: serine hydrolase [Aggregatilineales bacterium]|nr:serine hydrolase [Aggregatilineales bacterium]
MLRGSVGSAFTAVSAEIRQHGIPVLKTSYGTLDPQGKTNPLMSPVQIDTLFDLASLTKLFTTMAFFRLVDSRKVTLNTPVGAILPAFQGARPIRPYPNPLNIGELVSVVPPTDAAFDAGTVTFEHLLTHSSGLPAWLNLRDRATEAERLALCLTTPFAYPTGSQVLYSDIGYILLGKAIEQLTGQLLDLALPALVLRPLGLATRYGPIRTNVAPTEFDPWRGRRLVGEVHDENAATLRGVAGHAGLFGTCTDVAALGQLYLEHGAGFISQALAEAATRPHIADRGLGWMMRTPEGSSSGRYFSPNSYGHTGFVGTSLWVDPQRELVCALLTNNVFFGRHKEAIVAFRRAFHDTVIEALEGTP